MAGLEFVFWPDVENGHQSILHPGGQFLSRYWLHRIALAEIAADDFARFRHVPLAHAMKRRDEIENRWIAEPIEDLLAVAARNEQAGPPHQPQVLRGVGERQMGRGR